MKTNPEVTKATEKMFMKYEAAMRLYVITEAFPEDIKTQIVQAVGDLYTASHIAGVREFIAREEAKTT